MTEHAETAAELPLDGVGARLRRAREAAGLSRTQIAQTTRIPERHLGAIEEGNFGALPARTYAVGFSRSYAKAVGLDDKEIADAVRLELAGVEPGELRGIPSFEPGDPNRVPSPRLAWLAALLALLVILAGFAWWRGFFLPGGELPSLLPPDRPAATAPAPAASAPAAAPAATPAGPVVFTALEDQIWVKFYEGSGRQLLQKQLARGETFTVPADLPDVRLWTGRPEALAITIGGQPVPPISDVQRTVKDLPVSAAALLARGAAPGPATTPGAPAPVAAVPQSTARTVPVRIPAAVPAATSAPLPAPVQAVPTTAPGAATPAAAPAATAER